MAGGAPWAHRPGPGVHGRLARPKLLRIDPGAVRTSSPAARSSWAHWWGLLPSPMGSVPSGSGGHQVPGPHSADDSGGVGHDDDVVAEPAQRAGGDPPGVPAPEVEP